ncbi:MAG: 3-deoxy-D-manno-octulosonic acid transferase [Rhodobacteraceae bacterium]|nr:3-deoxy-D-manno-octulosonic acid transferase [Paracoccaceae bacterium]
MPTPLLLRGYQLLSAIAAPIAYRHITRKLRAAGVSEDRLSEHMGYASLSRPEGRLIWFHAASVGESLSVLTLIRRLGDRLPDASFLVTSGTANSAKILAKRLPPRALHQFAPLDVPVVVNRFYHHWAPDAGLFVESELWPNLLLHGQRAGVPLALVNARMSEKSVQSWRRWPQTAQVVVSVFGVLLAQNRLSADNLVSVGADPDRVRVGGNLKATSDPLPVNAETRDAVLSQLQGRPVWVAGSTHAGEEAVVLQAHRILVSRHPDLCLILIPRHPERGADVRSLIHETGLTGARRSMGEPIHGQTQVYLADTLGETGTWYALAPIVFLGGSLKPIGGHNPFEPAGAGAVVLTGPHVEHFVETYDPMLAIGAAETVQDGAGLAASVDALLRNPTRCAAAQTAARGFAGDRQADLDTVISILCTRLNLI